MKNFKQFQEAALSTAIYPERGSNIYYPALGLCGEAGEVAEKVKKIIRDKQGSWTQEDRQEIKKELGDVLWYLAACADEFDLQLEDVAQAVIQKLTSRQQRGVLGGSGDNR